ncbi:unnamed protein product [Didymodactylos carnosus]|uniref:Uncharacterized protein n=1 Tax=Didymodactylos carnosus TaxID=1234261 RepID=A0A815SRF4_9BILA|nr:unnamed protein product [Didymodactylos carnosus]CAF1495129.1 unnamed protein product [Didymodactylos carnosus]CAF4146474.1 unnamed protein product [Didymodactylos carnosus]CAF4357658.1 unnamed protein product [Didymodactylos carnosus]
MGDINKVKQHLKSMTLDDINRLESNGSTALHAACYYGHYNIVQLLLDYGASRTITNKHKCLPYEEAKINETKQLFVRPNGWDRFVGGTDQTGLIE